MYSRILVLILFSHSILAQGSTKNVLKDSTDAWNSEGNATLNFSNVGLKNWAGGGQSSLSLTSDFDYSSDYQDSTIIWDNDLSFIYGLTRQGDVKELRKTDDQLFLRSLFGRRLTKHSTISFLLELRTQVTNGFNYEDSLNTETKQLVSKFLAPGYLNMNLGWTLRVPKKYSLTISPFNGKFTFVLDDSLSSKGAFGVQPFEKVRVESGANINGYFTNEIIKNVVFKFSADLFTAYRRQFSIDANIRSSLRMKVNEYITSGVSITLIYDDDVDIIKDDGSVGTAWQFRNTITVGLSFSW